VSQFTPDEQLIEAARLLALPKVGDRRGNLTFIEGSRHIPFDIQRVYWIYDVPGGEVRGSHAYRQLEEVIIAISGSFEVALDDGRTQRITSLNRSYVGLYVPAMLWRQLRNFSTNAVALVVASRPYDPEDYVRDYDEFRRLRGASS
jgi:dTDP-4-dehydrorhamnose 3,5-epimerase-like enzyme